jgi:hypothetical protein
MRSFVLILSLFISSLSTAQDLVEFENGQVANANDMNANFSSLKEAIDAVNVEAGGCSATQQDNTVLFECADGTSAVLAGAGTVVQLGEGVTGETPPINFDTGPIVCKDNNDTIISEATGIGAGCDVGIAGNSDDLRLVNDPTTQTVLVGTKFSRNVWFTEVDCQGAPIGGLSGARIFTINGEFFTQVGDTLGSILGKSYRSGSYLSTTGSFNPASNCINQDGILNGYRQLAPFTPPAEITNAAYPVRVEQLP